MSEKQQVPLAKVIDPIRVDFAAEGLAYEDGIRYGTGGEKPLLMDIFYPLAAKAPMPVVVWIHGGGFRDPNLTRKYRPEPELAVLAKMGFFIASVDYRLCFEAKYPAQIQDVKCAVRYLRAHAKKYQIDPDRIGVWGESAGGVLASTLGVSGGVAEFEGEGGWEGVSSDVQAVCQWYATTDMRLPAVLHGENPDTAYGKLFEKPMPRIMDQVWRASPLSHIHRGMPPFLIMHGDADRLVPQGQSLIFYHALKIIEADAQFISVPGQGHGFFDGVQYYQAIYAFFLRTLG